MGNMKAKLVSVTKSGQPSAHNLPNTEPKDVEIKAEEPKEIETKAEKPKEKEMTKDQKFKQKYMKDCIYKGINHKFKHIHPDNVKKEKEGYYQPYIAVGQLIEIFDENRKPSPVCTGTLLNDGVSVLSAAHCFFGIEVKTKGEKIHEDYEFIVGLRHYDPKRSSVFCLIRSKTVHLKKKKTLLKKDFSWCEPIQY